jgi:hypothetical protein
MSWLTKRGKGTGIYDVKPVYIFTCNDDIR